MIEKTQIQSKCGYWQIENFGKLYTSQCLHHPENSNYYVLLSSLLEIFHKQSWTLSYMPYQQYGKESDFTILLDNGTTLKAIWHPDYNIIDNLENMGFINDKTEILMKNQLYYKVDNEGNLLILGVWIPLSLPHHCINIRNMSGEKILRCAIFLKSLVK